MKQQSISLTSKSFNNNIFFNNDHKKGKSLFLKK